MRIYLDNCCYKRPYDKQVEPCVIAEGKAVYEVLRKVDNNEVELTVSFLSIIENSKDPRSDRRNDTLNNLRKATIYVGSAVPIDALAKQLAQSLNAYDAVHIACAIAANCDYFLTTDNKILQLKDARIITINPVDFLGLWKEEYNDDC